MSLTRETLRKVRRIQIRTRVILESGIGGAYHAVFKFLVVIDRTALLFKDMTPYTAQTEGRWLTSPLTVFIPQL